LRKAIAFEFTKAIPPALHSTAPPDPKQLARYEPYTGAIYLSEKWTELGCMARTDGSQSEDIDCFAELIRHENHHRVELTQWWGPGMERYCGPAEPGCPHDWDLDKVPNDIEEKLGCKPEGVIDLEVNSYRVGWSWPP